MPRPLRIQLDGAVYLVSTRGLAEGPIFRDAQDYDAYLSLLAEYQQRHGCAVFAYCLLPDQVQLCLEPGDTTLSAIMHDLTAGYTRYFNRRYSRSGHLFQARYKSVIVEKAVELAAATAVVHLLPATAGISRDASYAYSSLSAYETSTEGIVPLQRAEVLASLPAETGSYREFVQRLWTADGARLAARFQQSVVGSEAFVAQARAMGRPAVEPVRAPAPAPAPIRRQIVLRPRRAVVAASASLLVVGLSLGVAMLTRRVSTLETALIALSVENDASFRASQSTMHAALPPNLRDLHGTRWDVRMTPLFGEATGDEQDELAFDERRVGSMLLASQGFSQSQYLVRSRSDGRGTWETAQTNAQGDLVLWQGEWRGPVMQGMVTRQVAGKPAERFTFVAVLRETDTTRSDS